MEKRHIIMIIILILFAGIMFSIKDSKNIKTLTCNVSGEMYEMQTLTTLEVKVKRNVVKDMKVTIDVTIPEEYQSEKQNLINNFMASGKMQVTSTENGIKLKSDMKSNYFNTLGLDTNSSYNELKSALELQGYTCK